MYQCHSNEQRYKTVQNDFVLSKEYVGAQFATKASKEDDTCGEDGAPPAEEQSRIIHFSRARLRWSVTPENHDGRRSVVDERL